MINFKPIDGSCTIYSFYLAEYGRLTIFLIIPVQFFFPIPLWETKGDKSSANRAGDEVYFQIIKEGYRFFGVSQDLQLEGRL